MSTVSGFQPAAISNIVLLGHTGAGKTTLAEAILHRCGAIPRLGSVKDGSTTGDFEPEARAHQHSTSACLMFGTYAGRQINVIDTPGSAELVGHALAALPAVEIAVIVVNAAAGIELGTRHLFHAAGEAGMARMVVVNHIDEHLAKLPGLVDDLRATFGASLHCINLPTGGGKDVIDCFEHDTGTADFGSVEDAHKEMLESTIEMDDADLERYLSGEAIEPAKLRADLVEAMNRGHVVPILFTCATQEVGIDNLLHILVEDSPTPATAKPRRVRRGEELVPVACDPAAALLAQVFKVVTDPYLGKVAMVRVLQGRIDGTTAFVAGNSKKPLKAGHLLKVQGRKHVELGNQAFAGDIVAIAKLDELRADTILHDPAGPDDVAAFRPKYPVPTYSLALTLKNKADEVKLSAAMGRLVEEDPTLRAGQDPETHELVLSGIGELHLRIALEKLKNRFSLEATGRQPTIAYHETITGNAEGHYRLKKQTGGAGQFGEVYLRVEPLPRGTGFEFVDDVVGGTIPTQYIPACEKGCQDSLDRGVVAGFPVHDVRAIVYDGKSHPVDSKDSAFRTAAKYAMKDAMSKAKPVLLEPIAALEISVPDRYTGDITGDLKNRRGQVVGVDMEGGLTIIRAQAPVAELGRYASQLRAMTGGHGNFTMEVSRYDVVPTLIQQRLSAERKPGEEKEE
ncbi:MAG: elongation factor G [Deltaproteobacteria bacterium]|nr:MAG: elongation factor G [Deltaproteobacteria bacterium]TMQ26743.1 MAG: elongation factor G [Deltaproteobacteria bacterium]